MHVSAQEHAEIAGAAGAAGSVALTGVGALAETAGASGGVAFWLAVISAAGAVLGQLLTMILRHRRESDRSKLRRENVDLEHEIERLKLRIELMERNGWVRGKGERHDDQEGNP